MWLGAEILVPMELIDTSRAIELVQENIVPHGRSEVVLTSNAHQRMLSSNVFSPVDYPSFDNSSVDGYAVCESAKGQMAKYKVVGKSIPGSDLPVALDAGQSCRVYTGAVVPTGTTGIVMQEDVSISEESVTFEASRLGSKFVRSKGSEFRAGELIVESGSTLTSGAIGLISAIGMTMVAVVCRPTVTIIVSGQEVVDSSCSPVGSQVRDSVSPMLRSLAIEFGADVIKVVRVGDSFENLCDEIQSASSHSDLIWITGGASVGDFDFSHRAIDALGEIYFHGVKIRPGRPTLFGKVGNSIIFGLPGNPGSAFVCFHLFVRTAILRLLGSASSSRWLWGSFGETHSIENRDVLMRAGLTIRDQQVWLHSRFEQDSFGLKSLALAEALVYLPADSAVIYGQKVRFLLV